MAWGFQKSYYTASQLKSLHSCDLSKIGVKQILSCGRKSQTYISKCSLKSKNLILKKLNLSLCRSNIAAENFSLLLISLFLKIILAKQIIALSQYYLECCQMAIGAQKKKEKKEKSKEKERSNPTLHRSTNSSRNVFSATHTSFRSALLCNKCKPKCTHHQD